MVYRLSSLKYWASLLSDDKLSKSLDYFTLHKHKYSLCSQVLLGHLHAAPPHRQSYHSSRRHLLLQ